MKNYSSKTKFLHFFYYLHFTVQIFAQSSDIHFPVKREEIAGNWRRGGLAAIEKSKNFGL